TVRAGGDGREGDASEAVPDGEVESRSISGCEGLRFPAVTAVPHGSDSVDDVARFQLVSAGDLRLARLRAAQRAALVEKFRPGPPVDGAVDTAAAEERRVGGVDDR